MAATLVVYDPPISSLPYLVVVFRPDGTLEVRPFKSSREAEAHAVRASRRASKPGAGNDGGPT